MGRFSGQSSCVGGTAETGFSVVTLDLGAVESFKSVYIEYANMAGSGINLPDSAKIELSSNGQDWTILAEATSDQFVGGPVLTRFEYTSETDLTARYIRFYFQHLYRVDFYG